MKDQIVKPLLMTGSVKYKERKSKLKIIMMCVDYIFIFYWKKKHKNIIKLPSSKNTYVWRIARKKSLL